MKVTLARVDERLIHGQVMTAWCKKCWIKTIILVDKEIAQDEFMISVLEMSAPAGVKDISKANEQLYDTIDDLISRVSVIEMISISNELKQILSECCHY